MPSPAVDKKNSPDLKLTQDLGFVRVGTATPSMRVADVDYNVAAIADLLRKACSQGVQVIAFPEMCLTGYTINDLVLHQALLSKAEAGLKSLLDVSKDCPCIVIVGMPVKAEDRVYNCAVVLNLGRILGAVPKTFLPTYREFYDHRWFASGMDVRCGTVELAGQAAPFGTDVLFKLRGSAPAIVGVEVCEDLWLPLSPHEYQAAAGALLLFNLSASNDIIAKADWRRTMVSSESGRCSAAYCYAASGIGESSNDVVFGGHSIIAENGVILAEAERLTAAPQLVTADIDLGRLEFDRRAATSFRDIPGQSRAFRIYEAEVQDPAPGRLRRPISPHPFVPKDPSRRAERCRDIFSMQVAALAQKLTGARTERIVIGVSGGLDSTLALLAAAKTMDFLGLPRQNVHAFTLPCFGTTRRTRLNAIQLSKSLEVSLKQVSIIRTAKSQLKDLGHSGEDDVVFENVQARYRTAFLFNKANQTGAIVLGTGDLTEIALGWDTFAGDHISHYHINTSVPKTLVRFLIQWVADEEFAGSPAQKALADILETPISPELRRPVKGQIAQMSEDVIGPVELADFYLYPFIRLGTPPGKILYMAEEVRQLGLFSREYTLEDLYRWEQSFIKRFFANQFKRTCLPEGPKIGSVSLSPRGDWRMPSDAEPALWLEDLDRMYRKLGGQL